MKTTMTSGISSTKLLVRGYAENFSLDDLWSIYSFYGAVSNIIIESHGATVTYKDQSVFPELDFNVEMELVVGESKMLFTKISQADSLDAYYPSPGYDQYGQYQAPLYDPHQPPPLSPHYDAAIVDVGQTQFTADSGHGQYTAPQYSLHQFSVPPPPLPGAAAPSLGVQSKPNIFTFDNIETEAVKTRDHGGCHVCSNNESKTGQPLTPITPSLQYPLPAYPPPTFYLPPPHQKLSASTLMSLSGTSLISSDSSSTLPNPIGPDVRRGGSVTGGPEKKQPPPRANYHFFTSPYKKFSKFQGVPTPATFPLNISQSTSSLQGGGDTGRGESGEKRSWYQAGDRWGHRRQHHRSHSQSEMVEQSKNGKDSPGASEKVVKCEDQESAVEGISNLSLN